jgi:hypothetical protein
MIDEARQVGEEIGIDTRLARMEQEAEPDSGGQ